ncbi:hypothetical protein SOVF_213900, partial [Spinacia oleracea]
GIGLEYHGNIAVLGIEIVDDPFADPEFAAGNRFETGYHPQQGRLAAAGRPDKHNKLAVLNGEIDAVNGFDRAIAFADVGESNVSHQSVSGSSALEAGMGEAFDKLLLGNHEDDEHGQRSQRRCGKLDVPHRPAIGVGILR